MTFKTLILEKNATENGLGVAVLKINRPEALNALNAEVLGELRSALKEIAADSTIRTLVLTGAGEKAFVAGADIGEMKDKTLSQATQFARLGQEVTLLIEHLKIPVIAAVNGFALGGGTELALACDFIVASEKAVFGQPEVALGVIPGFGGTVRLMKFVGLPLAKELIFTGRRVKADEASKMGLVTQVFPQEGFLKAVLELASTIALQSQKAVIQAKKLMNEFSETNGMQYKLDSEAQAFGYLFEAPDQKEGMTAFVEKRKAKFEGLAL